MVFHESAEEFRDMVPEQCRACVPAMRIFRDLVTLGEHRAHIWLMGTELMGQDPDKFDALLQEVAPSGVPSARAELTHYVVAGMDTIHDQIDERRRRLLEITTDCSGCIVLTGESDGLVYSTNVCTSPVLNPQEGGGVNPAQVVSQRPAQEGS